MAERELDKARLAEENASQLPAADKVSNNEASGNEGNQELSREAAPHWQAFYRSISDAVKRMRE